MLYDGQDRMSRRTFLKRYNVAARTEKRVRAQGRHPWPPWIILGGRVFYSEELTTRWFEQQSGVEVTDDELATAGGDAP